MFFFLQFYIICLYVLLNFTSGLKTELYFENGTDGLTASKVLIMAFYLRILSESFPIQVLAFTKAGSTLSTHCVLYVDQAFL